MSETGRRGVEAVRILYHDENIEAKKQAEQWLVDTMKTRQVMHFV
jgi:hypothetical protein